MENVNDVCRRFWNRQQRTCRLPRWSELPDIELYMDQVITYMNKFTPVFTRDGENGLTPSMINNYVKLNIIPPPVKKKYTKEHLLVLIFIYYFKSILSIKDIGTLLEPMISRYFGSESELDMERVYEEICQMEKGRVGQTQESVGELYKIAEDSFKDAPEEEREYLQMFAFICNLSFDVYIKKQLIEKLIDGFPEHEENKKKHKK